MGMSFGGMISSVQSGCGNTSAEYRTKIMELLLQQRRILFKRLHPEGKQSTASVTLAAGTGEYTLGSDVGFVTSGRGADGRKIYAKDDDDFQAEYATLQTNSGPPTIVRQYGRDEVTGALKISFYPVPIAAETVTLNVLSQPSTLVNDSDVSEMDEAFDEVVVDRAISKANLYNRKANDALAAHSIARDGARDFADSDRSLAGGRQNEIKQDPYVNYRRNRL